jgi:hypothetical protein
MYGQVEKAVGCQGEAQVGAEELVGDGEVAAAQSSLDEAKVV